MDDSPHPVDLSGHDRAALVAIGQIYAEGGAPPSGSDIHNRIPELASVSSSKNIVEMNSEIGRSTVYRSLNRLNELGLIEKKQQGKEDGRKVDIELTEAGIQMLELLDASSSRAVPGSSGEDDARPDGGRSAVRERGAQRLQQQSEEVVRRVREELSRRGGETERSTLITAVDAPSSVVESAIDNARDIRASSGDIKLSSRSKTPDSPPVRRDNL